MVANSDCYYNIITVTILGFLPAGLVCQNLTVANSDCYYNIITVTIPVFLPAGLVCQNLTVANSDCISKNTTWEGKIKVTCNPGFLTKGAMQKSFIATCMDDGAYDSRQQCTGGWSGGVCGPTHWVNHPRTLIHIHTYPTVHTCVIRCGQATPTHGHMCGSA